jgi:hypothetical protein
MEFNSYIIKNKDINTLLDEIDLIITDMCTFSKLHNGYSCNVDITRSSSNKNLFNAEINLRHEEQKDKERVRTPIEPPTLL